MAGGGSGFLGCITATMGRLANFPQLLLAVPGSSSSAAQADVRRLQSDLEYVERTWRRIKAVLADAEEREVTDKTVRLWLSDLQQLLYEADDLLDLYQYKVVAMEVGDVHAARISTGLRKRKKVDGQVCDSEPSFYSPSEDPLFRKEFTQRVEKIKDGFDEIEKMKDALHLKEHEGFRINKGIIERRPMGSFPVEAKIFGREADLSKVVDMLTNNKDVSAQIPRVVALVGMGGIGKTTLSQHAFNKPEVSNHFNMKGWVCVSDEFELVSLARKVLEAFTEKSSELTELSLLQKSIKKQVKGKKFLLVMDDVWNENSVSWNDFLSCLQFGAEGSTVLITARSGNVGNAAKAIKPFLSIGFLSEEDSWSFFKKCAFSDLVGQSAEDYPELIPIGEKIAKKCRGLPLALKVLGCCLWCYREQETWDSVLKSNLWDTDTDIWGNGKQIIGPLLLSYLHLPAHLKPCFKLCKVFVKDYKIKREQLISFWAAHGLIEVEDRDNWLDIVEAGSRYINSLVSRSLLQHDGKNDSINLTMHDLIHDLVLFLSRDEKMQRAPRSLVLDCESQLDLRCLSGKYLRVLDISVQAISNLLISSTLLRSLKLEIWAVSKLNLESICGLYNLRELCITLHAIYFRLPDSIGNLKHLLRLHLVFTTISVVPESIGALSKLQSLHLGRLSDPDMLPESILNLTRLHEIYVFCHGDTFYFPVGFGKLRNIRKLGSCFHLGKHVGITELKDMTLIEGKLQIKELHSVQSPEDAKQANLMIKEKLQELELHWKASPDSHDAHVVKQEEQVFENLRPHPNLQSLKIVSWNGTMLPSWLTQDPPYLTRLVSLYFNSCPNLGSSFCIGSMPRLRTIEIDNCRMDSFNVNSLLMAVEKLHMTNCKNLKSLPIYRLTVLEYLKIRDCGDLEVIEFNNTFDLAFTSSTPSAMMHVELSKDRIGYSPSGASIPSALKRVELHGCTSLTSLSLYRLIALEFLKVHFCEKLERIEVNSPTDCYSPNGSRLSALKRMELGHCHSLISLSLHRLTAPEILSVMHCQKLERIDLNAPNGCYSPTGSTLSALKHVKLHYCNSLKSISLNWLTALEFLKVWNCQKLQLIDRTDPPAGSALPALKWVELCASFSLISLSLYRLTALEILKVRLCVKLERIDFTAPNGRYSPTGSTLSALKRMELRDCSSLISISLYRLTALEILRVMHCQKVQLIGLTDAPTDGERLHFIDLNVPNGYSSSLKHLEISSSCHSATSISLYDHNALEILRVRNCLGLKTVNFSGPLSTDEPVAADINASLKEMGLSDCQQLEAVRIPNSVKELTLCNCPKLRDAQIPKSVEIRNISRCSLLETGTPNTSAT